MLQAPPRGDAARQLPIILRAREVRGRPDIDASAEGEVEFRRGGMVIQADKLSYDQAEDLARATGHVVVTRDGNVFSGPELQLKVERFEGFFRTPTYRFARTGAGGKATLIEFIDDQRAAATDATYSSCTIEDADGEPVWILKAGELRIDSETNEGIARDAVLRFYGVPILASPVLSFPLSEERKSGFLPPSFGIDSRSGFQAAIPYYWNIAPNRDATFTMQESVRRGPSLDGEFRYLEPSFFGSVNAKVLPNDRAADRSRYSFRAEHDGALPYDAYVQLRVLRVSDDDYWKDFPGEIKSLTPRLLQTDLLVSRPFGDWSTYARAMRWQVLQTEDPTTRIIAPYERAPQVGARYAGPWRGGFDVGFEAEVNRFANPDDRFLVDAPDRCSHPRAGQHRPAVRLARLDGDAEGLVQRGELLARSAAHRRSAQRFTRDPDGEHRQRVDAGAGDRALRAHRAADARAAPVLRQHAVSAPGVRAELRLGAEGLQLRFALHREPVLRRRPRLRFEPAERGRDLARARSRDRRRGLARRPRPALSLQRPARHARRRAVDAALFRRPRLRLDEPGAALELRHGAAVQPGQPPHRALARRHALFARAVSNRRADLPAHARPLRAGRARLAVAGLWPRARWQSAASALAGGSGCGGTLYGVGHLNYSTRDSRLTDSIVGLEYDAGCWIGRVVVERLSTGRSEATTRLLLQLELVGLSRIGSNPLRVLKDNVPGYQLLREERTTTTPFTPYD